VHICVHPICNFTVFILSCEANIQVRDLPDLTLCQNTKDTSFFKLNLRTPKVLECLIVVWQGFCLQDLSAKRNQRFDVARHHYLWIFENTEVVNVFNRLSNNEWRLDYSVLVITKLRSFSLWVSAVLVEVIAGSLYALVDILFICEKSVYLGHLRAALEETKVGICLGGLGHFNIVGLIVHWGVPATFVG
jgi:hypothetical protein